VEPGTGLVRKIADRPERVDRAGVDVAHLGADDRRRASLAQALAEDVGAHGAALVDRDDIEAPLAEPEDPQRPIDGDVPLFADDQPHARRTDQPVPLDVPSGLCQHPVPRRRERGHVRHLTARDERERRVRRQPQQVDQPSARDLLHGGCRRSRTRQPGVLIPRAHHPVGCDGHRQRAADDEAEVARRPHRGDARLGVGDQLVEHSARVDGRLGQDAFQRAPNGRRAALGFHRPLGQGLEI
jgi:hypothetical protein